MTWEMEAVRGHIGPERAAAIRAFWAEHDALGEEEWDELLPGIVCVALDSEGAVAGFNFVREARVELIGGRSFWIYRGVLLEEAAEADTDMLLAAFAALEAEFDPGGEGPIGLCVLLGPGDAAEHPEMVMDETGLIHAGYLGDGTRLRIRYFDGAAIGPGLPSSPSLAETRATVYELEDRYRIVPFAAARDEGVTPDDVIAFWGAEGAVAGDEANRRVHEVLLVALERDRGIAGVSTAYLQRNAQLRTDLHYYRAFVGAEHRMGDLAGMLAVTGRDLLEARFTDGEDTRATGVAYEVENDGLKRYFNKALWLPTDFTFIGENERGDHVRVHWFPGARISAP